MNNISWLSEEGNDKWIAEIFDYKTKGFFVDAGATGGLSNSAIVLEKYFGWTGISVNPNQDHYNKILKSQKRMNVENVALLDYDGETDFYYAPIGMTSKSTKTFNQKLQDLSYASCVTKYKYDYSYKDLKKYAKIVKVKCSTLESLLDKYNAPNTIEYVGLDIEGAEYDTLRVFPFDKYKILALSIENSELIQDHLQKNGFTRVVNPYCPKHFEHHYINNEILGDYPFEKY